MVLKQSAINVDKKTVRCDGLPFQFSYEKHRQAQAHPAVYLKINKDNKADCPYCGRIVFYKEKAEKLMD